MRSQIFRTSPVLVENTDQIVCVKDMDGCDPFDLFIENVDVAASARTKFGSKNANLRFVATTAGADGNAIEIIVESVAAAPVSQEFTVAVLDTTATITLQTDASGQPNLTADEVAALLNADVYFASLARAVRALGSDGSALFGLYHDTDHATRDSAAFSATLSGGFDAVQLGDVDVFVSPTGWPDFSGPWEELSDTTFDSLGVNVIKSLAFKDAPIKGLMVKATPGAYDSMIVVSAVARKKGGV